MFRGVRRVGKVSGVPFDEGGVGKEEEEEEVVGYVEMVGEFVGVGE